MISRVFTGAVNRSKTDIGNLHTAIKKPNSFVKSPLPDNMEDNIELDFVDDKKDRKINISIKIILLFVDTFLINCGFLAAFWLRYDWPFPKVNFTPYSQSFIFLTAINLLMLALFKVYKSNFRSSWDMFVKVSTGLFAATLLSVVFVYIFRARLADFPTSIFAFSLLVNLLFVFKFNQWLLKINKRIKKRVVVVGRDEIDINEITIKKASIEYYQINHFSELIKYRDAHEIVICDTIHDKKDMDILIDVVQRFGINVTFSPSGYRSLLFDKFNGNGSFGFLKTFIGKQTDFEEALIRTLDIVGSVTFLIACLPIMTLTSILIKLSSPGPVIYKQHRAGKDGNVFMLYKFRTMVVDAEKLSGFKSVVSGDSRITKIGLFLRKTRIDETPQLLNVLNGNMSLVGPRPENLYRISIHKALQGIRLAVKPGITGLAQVRSYYDLAPSHKIKYDYLYIQKRSLLLNMYLLIKTIPVVLLKKGT